MPTKVADSTSYASQIRYHANGLLKTYTYGNGLKFSQLLNAEYKPYERAVQKGAVNRYAQRYQYDQTNNLTTITDLVQSSQSVAMSYDGLDRLKTATGPWGAGAFDYDETGNILTKELGSQKLLYSYDLTSKRLNTVTGGYAFSYDDRSNVTHNGKLAFNYNRANQLINAAGLSYSYDGHGRRVMKSSASATAYSIYNQAGKLLMTDGANGLVRYIYLGNDLIAKVGSSLALEDKPGYTGHVEDKTLGLTYMQQRYYDPVIGRFYSNDPIGFRDTQSFNRYSYANNNPYKYVDPTGMASQQIDSFCGVSGCDYSYSAGGSSNADADRNKNSKSEPDYAESVFLKGYHYYSTTRKICIIGLNFCSVDEVAWVMKESGAFPNQTVSLAPYEGSSVTSNVRMFGDDYIQTFVGTHSITNVTYPNHFLHPGNVTRSVFSLGDTVYIQTVGVGWGYLGGLNNAGKEHVWGLVDNVIIKQFE